MKLSRSKLVSKMSIVEGGGGGGVLNKEGREWKIFQKFIVVGPSTSDPRESKFFNSIFVSSRMHSKSICKYFVMR